MKPLTVLLLLLASASVAAAMRLRQQCPIPKGLWVLRVNNSELGELQIAVYNSHDVVSREIRKKGFWEIEHPRELALLANRTLPHSGTFLDVGANIGWYTLLFAKIGYDVIAVEPIPLNRKAIETTLCLNPDIQSRVRLAPVALVAPEDVRSKCVMNSGSRNLGNAILHCSADTGSLPCDPGANSSEGLCEAVRTGTLDGLMAELNLTRVDVVKMDIEGFECNALRGGQSLFDKFHVKLLQVETNRPHVAECFAAEAKKHHYKMGTGVGHDDNRVMARARLWRKHGRRNTRPRHRPGLKEGDAQTSEEGVAKTSADGLEKTFVTLSAPNL